MLGHCWLGHLTQIWPIMCLMGRQSCSVNQLGRPCCLSACYNWWCVVLWCEQFAQWPVDCDSHDLTVSCLVCFCSSFVIFPVLSVCLCLCLVVSLVLVRPLQPSTSWATWPKCLVVVLQSRSVCGLCAVVVTEREFSLHDRTCALPWIATTTMTFNA